MITAKRILVIDDSPFIFKAVKKALEPHGYEIVGYAENGKRGLEMIKDLNPDLITLDITMPILDGLEVAAILIDQKTTSKIIMLSAMSDHELLEQARQIGIEHFVPKPFKPDQLSDLVKYVFETSESYD